MKFPVLIASALLITCSALPPVLANDLPEKTSPSETEMNPCGNGVLEKDTEGDLLVRHYCTKCHSESRIMNALQSMHGSQNNTYDKEVKSIISRKIRLTNGDISRQDGKKIIDYLVSIWSRQATRCKTAS